MTTDQHIITQPPPPFFEPHDLVHWPLPSRGRYKKAWAWTRPPVSKYAVWVCECLLLVGCMSKATVSSRGKSQEESDSSGRGLSPSPGLIVLDHNPLFPRVIHGWVEQQKKLIRRLPHCKGCCWARKWDSRNITKESDGREVGGGDQLEPTSWSEEKTYCVGQPYNKLHEIKHCSHTWLNHKPTASGKYIFHTMTIMTSLASHHPHFSLF